MTFQRLWYCVTKLVQKGGVVSKCANTSFLVNRNSYCISNGCHVTNAGHFFPNRIIFLYQVIVSRYRVEDMAKFVFWLFFTNVWRQIWCDTPAHLAWNTLINTGSERRLLITVDQGIAASSVWFSRHNRLIHHTRGKLHIHCNTIYTLWSENCNSQCAGFFWKTQRYIKHLVSILDTEMSQVNDDVIKWKHFPRYWPFVRGICVWINGWVNNREASDFRRYRAHYDVTVMLLGLTPKGGQDGPHCTQSILWLLMTWRHKEPMQQKTRYWLTLPGIPLLIPQCLIGPWSVWLKF